MLPIQITMKDIPSSPTLKAHIEERAQKLQRFYSRLSACRVVIDLPQKHKHQGKLFNVKIDVTVPGKEFVATRKVNQDIYVALRDAFEAIERQLEDHARKRHGRTKTHERLSRGFIKRILPEGYGFIEGHDGIEYYFSELNIGYPSFARLEVGDLVDFIPQTMSNGHHAHHIMKARQQSA